MSKHAIFIFKILIDSPLTMYEIAKIISKRILHAITRYNHLRKNYKEKVINFLQVLRPFLLLLNFLSEFISNSFSMKFSYEEIQVTIQARQLRLLNNIFLVMRLNSYIKGH